MSQRDSLGYLAAFGQQIDNLRDAKDSQGHSDQRNAVKQIELAEGIAIDGIGGSRADAAQQQPQASGQPAFKRRAAGEKSGEGEAENAEHQQLGRAEEQNQRPRDGQGESQKNRADQAADHRRQKRRAQCPRSLALLGQWMTIQNCHGGRGGTWCADEHRGDGIGSVNHRERSDQQDHRGVHVERIDKRQQDGDAGDAAQAGQDADDRAGKHAGHQHAQMKRIGEPLKSD